MGHDDLTNDKTTSTPPVMPFPRPTGREKAFTWSLVLTAVGIPHQLEQQEEGWIILVPKAWREEAIRQIRLFEDENRKSASGQAHEHRPIRYARESIWSILMVSAAMSLTFRYEIREKALATGAASSDRIMDGEWWRAITALWLHADPSHFLSNMVIGGFIIFWLIEETSPGAGWFLALLTGAVGNYVNALIHGYDGHISIGASTAVFGALGSLCGLRAVKRKNLPTEMLRAVGAGLALLAMLGSGKERVDLGAHLFGFVAGLGAGSVTGFIMKSTKARLPYTGRFLGILSYFVVTAAWILAVFKSKPFP